MPLLRVSRGIVLRLKVYGMPRPQGSMRAFVRGGKPIITATSKGLKGWRDLVAFAANEAAQDADAEMVEKGPVHVDMMFSLPRPKAEPKTRRTWPDRRPDLDKLVRAVLDALTGVAFHDDGQVVSMLATKDWGRPGVEIVVSRIEGVK